MSEDQAYVACDCARRGLVSPPPTRDPITFDRFGNVMRASSWSPEDDPWNWCEWRAEFACFHSYMRIAEFYWSSRGWREEYPEIANTDDFPVLKSILEDGEYFCSAMVLADTETSKLGLMEAQRLFGSRNRDVLRRPELQDKYGFSIENWWEYDQVCQPGSPLYRGFPAVAFKDGSAVSDALYLRVDGSEITVLAGFDARVLFRTSLLLQSVDPDDQALTAREPGQQANWSTVKVTWSSPEGESATGYARAVRYEFNENVESRDWYPTSICVAHPSLTVQDLPYPLGPLVKLMQFSVQTGNPVVVYYNGSSIGYDVDWDGEHTQEDDEADDSVADDFAVRWVLANE